MKRKFTYKSIKLRKIKTEDIVYLFEKNNKRWDNYLEASEVIPYIKDIYEEFNIFYDKKDTYYVLKNKNCILFICYVENGIYSGVKIIEKKCLKSYVLMNEKLEFLIKEVEDRKNKILNFNSDFLF